MNQGPVLGPSEPISSFSEPVSSPTKPYKVVEPLRTTPSLSEPALGQESLYHLNNLTIICPEVR